MDKMETMSRGIAASILLLLLSSCTLPFFQPWARGSARISISDASSASKTILPPSGDLVVDTYYISATGPNGHTYPRTAIAVEGTTIGNLVVGSWTFTAEGENSAFDVVTKGEVEIGVLAGQTVSDTIVMAPLTEGAGSFSFILTWTGVEGVTVEAVEIVPRSGQDAPGMTGWTTGDHAMTFTDADLDGGDYDPLGMYDVYVELSRNVEVPVYVRVVEGLQVYAGLASTKTMPLTASDFESPPKAPTGFAAVATPSGISLTWIDNSNTEEGFLVYREVEGEGILTIADTLSPNASSFLDSGANSGTPYTYGVYAFNSIGMSSVCETDFWPTGIGIVGIPQITLTIGGVPSKIDFDQSIAATVTPSQAVDSYKWYLDGTLGLTGDSATSWDLSMADLDPGAHRIAVVATKNGVGYSAEKSFDLTKTKAFTSFGFASPAATGLIDEAGRLVRVVVPAGTNRSDLVAVFATTGARVEVGSTTQTSGSTPNNFTSGMLNYFVYAVDNEWVEYEVQVVSPPSVTTAAISSIGTTTASSGGTCTEDPIVPVNMHGVSWSTAPNPTTADAHTTDSGTTSWTSGLTGLVPGTTYYVRAYSTNEAGTGYGNELSFTTKGPPQVYTTSVSAINAASATGAGQVMSDGGYPVTERGVCWSTNHDPTVSDGKSAMGSGTGTFSGTFTGLSPNTTYFLRTYATNSHDTAYGSELTFRTVGWVGPAGGLVFYDKGSYSDGWRYLEAAPSDQSSSQVWGGFGTLINNTSPALGSGPTNTANIVSALGAVSSAALLCQDLKLNAWGDWFLPSIQELEFMYTNLRAEGLGGLLQQNYWSSSEVTLISANQYDFNVGNVSTAGKDVPLYVRAIRRF